MSRIVLPMLKDPTDIIVQGDSPLYWSDFNMFPFGNMGEPGCSPMCPGMSSTIDPMPVIPVPTTPYVWLPSGIGGILPRTIGTMVLGGGQVVMQGIGIKPTPSPSVIPLEKYLYDNVDKALNSSIPSWASRDPSDRIITPCMYESPEYNLARPIPMPEMALMGIVKNMTNTLLPASFQQRCTIDYGTDNDAITQWFIRGVTKNSSGTPIGGCRVVLFISGRIGVVTVPDKDANPVIAETVSDASGNYSIQVNKSIYYQAMAYLAGSPDVAGLTVNTLVPVVV